MVGHAMQKTWLMLNAFVKKTLMVETAKLTKGQLQLQVPQLQLTLQLNDLVS